MKKAIKIGREFLKQVKTYHLSAYASSTAFFTFLSLIPMMLVFFSILPYTPLTEAKMMEIAGKLLPDYLRPLSISVVSQMYDKSGALLSVTLIVTLWSSAKGTLALLRGLNVINGVEEKRNYVFLRLRACLYTVILLVIILVLLIMVVFGERIVSLLTGAVPNIHYLFDFLQNFQILFVIALLTLFFCAVFTWMPNKKNHFMMELPGAIFVSLTWYLASVVFSVYVNRYFAYNMYGSLATVTIIMFWLYMCFYIVLIGALINRFLNPFNLFLMQALKLRRQKEKK